MSQGGIERDELAKIWYKSLLKLQSDAGYFDCRAAVMNAAKDMKLSTDKISIIQKAFREAGISNELNSKVWYYENMKSALDKGYVQGYIDGTVKPSQFMTNAEFLAVLTKAYSSSVGSSTSLSSTYPSTWRNHWACNELKYAYDNNWIIDSLEPNRFITREEAGAYLWRAYVTEKAKIGSTLKLQIYNSTSKNAWVYKWSNSTAFKDQSNISSDYRDELFQLYVNRIYNGTTTLLYNHKIETTLNPKEILDRATCCTIIMRTFK